MSALQLLFLAALAVFGVTQAQSPPACFGRFMPISPLPRYEPFYGIDDLNAMLLLAKALDSNKISNSNNNSHHSDVNSGEIINKLINALIYTTTKNGGGSASCESGHGGSGGSGGKGGSNGSSSNSSGGSSSGSSGGKKSSPLIDLGLLTDEDLLKLMLAGKDVLDLNLGGKGDSSGSKNDGGGVGGAVSGLLSGLL